MSEASFTEEFLNKVAADKSISEAELEALRLALQKRKSKDIAKELGISEAATRKRLGEVYKKFDIEGRGPGKLASLAKVLQRQRMSAEPGALTMQRRIQHLDTHYEWNDAPSLNAFQGRVESIKALKQWVLRPTEQQKLLFICGMGGVGKSYLARKLAEDLNGQFHQVVWLKVQLDQSPVELLKKLLSSLQINHRARLDLRHSLEDSSEVLKVERLAAKSLDAKSRDLENLDLESLDLEGSVLKNLGTQSVKSKDKEAQNLINQIIKALSLRRYLIVLDGFEVAFKSLSAERSGGVGPSSEADPTHLADEEEIDVGIPTFEASPYQQASLYRDGFEEYGRFISKLQQSQPSSPCQEGASCVVVTSREKPKDLSSVIAENSMVRLYAIAGLKNYEAEALLNRYKLKGQSVDYKELMERYQNHPMALRLAANAINDIFKGRIRDFLDQEISLFDSLRNVIGEQFKRLSPLETEAMYWLVINHVSCSLEDLKADIVAEDHRRNLIYTLRSLERRFLVEVHHAGVALYGLHPLVSEYVLSRFIRWVVWDLVKGDLSLFNSYALLKADAQDFLRDFQKSHIIQPVLERLKNYFKSKTKVEKFLNSKLESFREHNHYRLGYAGGNFVNLMVELSQGTLSSKDFSELMIWQAYLQDVQVRNVNFQSCELNRSVFTETLSDAMAIALTPAASTAVVGQTKSEYIDAPLLACGDTNGVVHLWQTELDSTKQSAQNSAQSLQQNQKWAEWAAHSGWVRAIAFVPESALLVSGGEDGLLKLWQLPIAEQPTLRAQQLWQQETDAWVYAVAISPDRRIVACGGENQITLHRIEDGTELYRLPDNTKERELSKEIGAVTARPTQISSLSQVRSLSFSSDGQWLASSGDDEIIRVWRIETQPTIRLVDLKELGDDVEGHEGWVRSIAFVPDSHQLVSGGDDRTVRLWDVKSERCQQIVGQTSDRIRAIAISPDGQFVASGGDDSQVFLWNLKTLKRADILPTAPSRVWSVAFQTQGEKLLLAAGGDKQTLQLWQVQQRASQQQNKKTGSEKDSGDRNNSNQLKSSHKLQQDIQQNRSQVAALPSVDTKRIRNYRGYTSGIRAVNFLSDRLIVSAGDDREISIWDSETGKVKASLSLHRGRVWAIAVDRENKRIASASDDHTVRLWDMKTGQCLTTLTAHTSWVRTVAFSNRGRLLASGGDDGTIRIWNTASGSCLSILECGVSWVRAVSFDPTSSRYLISGGEDGKVRFWDRKMKCCLHTLAEHSQRICSVAYSPNGDYIASGSDDKTVVLWDVQQQAEVCRFEDAELGIKAVAFSPDGRYLAAGGEDQLVYVWNLETPKEKPYTLRPKDYTGGSGGVRSIAFSPDSQQIISGGLDEIIRVGLLSSLETEEIHFLRCLAQHERPYKDTKIAEVKGLSGLQKANLLALGAVDRTEPLLM